jgi:TRAP-type uncharacterized transport system fused permease subunit
VTLLSAHLIIFWLSQDSNVTPPVCLAAFTAAALAEAPPMKTGFTAWKIAKGLYFVPMLIAYTPLIGGTWVEAVEIFFFAIFGFWALSAAIEGHWESRMGLVERVAILAVAAILLWPMHLYANLAGLAAFAVLLVLNIRRADPARRSADEPALT